MEDAGITMVEGLLPEVTAYDIGAVTELMNSYKADGYYIGLMESGSTVTVQNDVIPELSERVYGIIVYRNAEFVAVDAETVAGLPRTDGEVRLIIEDATPENINVAQIRTVGDNYAASIRLLKGDQTITELEGVATILLIPGYESDKVYWVAETGEKQPIDATYYEDLGGAIFIIDHLSIYMVEDQSKQSEGKTCWLCWLVILI